MNTSTELSTVRWCSINIELGRLHTPVLGCENPFPNIRTNGWDLLSLSPLPLKRSDLEASLT